MRFDGSGSYRRDPDGTWRYTVGGDPVPGARDLLLGDLYRPESDDDPELGHDVVVVPRQWVGLRPGHPLAWVTEHGELGSREPFRVPSDTWRAHLDDVVGMDAPELHPGHLLGVEEVAAAAGVSAVTVRAYLHRRQMPLAAFRVAGSPVWTRPVIERWLASRAGSARTSGFRRPDGGE